MSRLVTLANGGGVHPHFCPGLQGCPCPHGPCNRTATKRAGLGTCASCTTATVCLFTIMSRRVTLLVALLLAAAVANRSATADPPGPIRTPDLAPLGGLATPSDSLRIRFAAVEVVFCNVSARGSRNRQTDGKTSACLPCGGKAAELRKASQAIGQVFGVCVCHPHRLCTNTNASSIRSHPTCLLQRRAKMPQQLQGLAGLAPPLVGDTSAGTFVLEEHCQLRKSVRL